MSEKRALRDNLAYVQDKRMLLLHLQQRLAELADGRLSEKRHRLAALSASLHALSPLAVLGRGYAMVQREDGQILKSVRETAPGAHISVTLGEGKLSAAVTEIGGITHGRETGNDI